jgi:hypothetical protein
MSVEYHYINRPLFVYLASSGLFLLMGGFFMTDLPVSESVYFWEKASSLSKALTIVWHPPVYSFLLSLVSALFNDAFFGGYLLGQLSAILTAGLIYRLILAQREIPRLPALSLWLLFTGYYSLPLVLHGAFIYDIDNTLLPPVLLAIYCRYLRFLRQPDLKNAGWFWLSILAAFWIKMTTPVLLLGAIGAFHLLRADFRFLLTRLLPIMIAAAGCFYISYGWLYTGWVLDGYGSFQFSGGKAWGLIMGQNTFQLSWRELLFSVGSNTGALVAWTSPLFCCLLPIWLWLYRKPLLESVYPKSKCAIQPDYIVPLLFIVITIIGYTIILKIQTSAGFPKYHYPMFAFFFILLGIGLTKSDMRIGRFEFFFFVLATVLFSLMIKDHLLQFYELGRLRHLRGLAGFFLWISVGMILPALILAIYRRRWVQRNPHNLLSIGLLVAIAINLAGFFWRAQADYHTNYHYGIKGTPEVLAWASSVPPTQSVYLPFAGYFIQQPKVAERSEYGRLLGTDPYRPLTDYLIMTDHLLYNGNYFFGPEWVETHYQRVKTLDSYTIWKRNPATGSNAH